MEQLNLFDIAFPVYSLPREYIKIWDDFNVTYLETRYGIYVLDNKNMQGDTVGKRRLHVNNSILYRPRHVYYNIPQFLHSNTNMFMDSLGRVFKYKKTHMVPLKYHKIIDIKRLESGDCSIELKINLPIKVNCRLAHSVQYVAVLHTKWGYILYSFSEYKKDDTRRKI
jgi:hypothetical protein